MLGLGAPQNECAGGLVGAPMGTAAKHAAEFTTMSFGRPDVHRAIVAAFKAGLAATIAGDLTAVSVAREEIAKQLRIPALQVYSLSPHVTGPPCRYILSPLT